MQQCLVRTSRTLRRGAGANGSKSKRVALRWLSFRKFTSISRNFRRYKPVRAPSVSNRSLISTPVASILLQRRRFSKPAPTEEQKVEEVIRDAAKEAPAAPRIIETFLFEGFEMLDVFGPLELFKAANNALAKRADAHAPFSLSPPALAYVIRTTALGKGPMHVRSSGGPAVVADLVVSGDESKVKKDDADERTTLLIPGGAGTRPAVTQEPVIEWLASRSAEVGRVCTVCTGSALLARTGLLDGLKATTNKIAYPWVTSQRPLQVQWQPRARWVRSSPRIWTSSGVSAGMDMAYAIIAEDLGEKVAEEAARYAEYVPDTDATNDPFAK